MYSFAVKSYGMLISCKEVLPYFARARFKQGPFIPADTKNAEEIKLQQLMSLPLDEFAVNVKSGSLPDDFYDMENDNLVDFEGLSAEIDFTGVFRLLKELIPDNTKLESVDPDHWDESAQYAFDFDLVFYLPLTHQPTLFKYPYKDGNEVITEVKAAIKDLGVELPDDFPYWKVIGVLDGVTADN